MRELWSRRVARGDGVRDVVRLSSRVAAELLNGVMVVVVSVGLEDDGDSRDGARVFRRWKDRWPGLHRSGGPDWWSLIGQDAIT